MVGRKGGLSGKQKSVLLKNKRAQTRDKDERPGGSASGGSASTSAAATGERPGMRMVQQVSRKGEVNTLSTRFVREDDEVVAARKLHGSTPIGPPAAGALVYMGADSSLGLPTRPPEHAAHAAAQEAMERASFEEWLAQVHEKYPLDALSPFEHNIEVWRQLWRCLERSDVVCIIVDIRNPLLHVPPALYEHCARRTPALRIVIVLSKVDLVDAEHVNKWRAELGRRFPLATLALFSSKGKAVGASISGGVASRRRQIHSQLSAAERRQVREPFSAVRLLAESLDLVRLYNLRTQVEDLAEEEGQSLSPLSFCLALAERKGYRLARGRGALDAHRAGLEILKDCVDGVVCLAFVPPEAVASA